MPNCCQGSIEGLEQEYQKDSGTTPYGHLGNTVTSLLRPLFFGPAKFGRISGLAVLLGQGQISWLEDRNNKYTIHRIRTSCTTVFAVINNRNADIAYHNSKTTWNFPKDFQKPDIRPPQIHCKWLLWLLLQYKNKHSFLGQWNCHVEISDEWLY